jgi:hypothetical protein
MLPAVDDLIHSLFTSNSTNLTFVVFPLAASTPWQDKWILGKYRHGWITVASETSGSPLHLGSFSYCWVLVVFVVVVVVAAAAADHSFVVSRCLI